MSSLAISLIVTGLITGGGLLGLVLQRVLPERYTTDKARDMIGGVVGQLTLLLVLVNGLLIWTAYGVYSTQQTELQTMAARALEFDLEMRQFGPAADDARSMLRTDLVWAHEQFWGDDTSRAAAYEASYKAMGNLNKFLDSLEPKTPAQTSLLAAARANYAFIGEQRLLMSLQAATPIPWPLIYAVTFWACPPVRQHGAVVEIEPDADCDARHGQRVDRTCNLSDPRVQPALHQLDPRLARATRTGNPSTRPAERCKSERPGSVSHGGKPMAHFRILSDAEIRSGLAELPDWSLRAPNIEARFELKTFRDAIAFIVEIAIEAEVMNHHPEFHNSYNVVSFSFCTHDAGMKITDLDIETARRISALARRFQSMA